MKLSIAALFAGILGAASSQKEGEALTPKSKTQPVPKKSKRITGKRTRSLKTRAKRVKAQKKAKRKG